MALARKAREDAIVCDEVIAAAKVRVNGQRVLKVSRPVRLGDVVTGTAASRFFVVRVAGERRLPGFRAGESRGPSRAAAHQARLQALDAIKAEET